MKKAIILLFALTLMLSAKDYNKYKDTRVFINMLVKKYDFKQKDLEKLFSKVKVQKSALRAFLPHKEQPRIKETCTAEKIAKAKELCAKYGYWERYARLSVTPKRVNERVDA